MIRYFSLILLKKKTNIDVKKRQLHELKPFGTIQLLSRMFLDTQSQF